MSSWLTRRTLFCWYWIAATLLFPASSWSFGHHDVASRRAALARVGGYLTVVTTMPCLPSVARNLPEPTGASGTKTGTIEALIPIVQIRETLISAKSKLGDWKAVSQALASLPQEEISFKVLFDEYSDPVSYKQKFLDQNAFLVYYTKGFDGPNRPSIESDLPEKQTLQFGARNEAWVAWNDLQAELAFVRKNPEDDNDVKELVCKTLEAVQVYLKLAPASDVANAEKQLASVKE